MVNLLFSTHLKNMSKQVQVTIKNESDAWEFVEKWMSGEEVLPPSFDGWPHLNFTIKGDEYKSSLRSGQMDALISFQMSMGRAYASIAHGAYDKRRLTKAEEEQLEFTTTVKKGSSITETDLTPLVHAVSQLVTNRPIESLVAAVIIGLAIVSKSAILKHFDNKSKQMEQSVQLQLIHLTDQITQADRARWKTLDAVLKKLGTKFPSIEKIVPDVSRAYWHLANASSNANSVEISGVNLSSADLDVLSERRRSRPTNVTEVTESFSVEGIMKIGSQYRVQLRSETYHLSALYRTPHMSDAKVSRLIKRMTSSQKIIATVKIKVIEGSQIQGELLKFSADDS